MRQMVIIAAQVQILVVQMKETVTKMKIVQALSFVGKIIAQPTMLIHMIAALTLIMAYFLNLIQVRHSYM